MIRHSCNWTQDRCSHWLSCRGCSLDYICPPRGEPLPDANRYSAAIVFGGVHSANECNRYHWMRDELNWIEHFMALERPLLGICLGAQLIARTLGARVGHHPEQVAEIGFRPLYPTAENHEFIAPGQLMFQWHNEGFDLPDGAELLASGEQFPNQAFRYGDRVAALQFHPEANHEVIQCWHDAAAINSDQPTDDCVTARHLHQARQLDAPISHWLDGFLDNWIDPKAQ